MILAIGGQKGGTGKSTISVNLTAFFKEFGHDVLLIDANSEQGTASNWADRRENLDYTDITCIEKSGNIKKSVEALAEKYDIIIIDTGGQDSQELRTSLIVADILISPVRASQADVETLTYMLGLIETAKEINPELEVRILITNAHTNPRVTTLNETIELIDGVEELDRFKTAIYTRESYPLSIKTGAGVNELKPPQKKAMNEIKELAEEIVALYNN